MPLRQRPPADPDLRNDLLSCLKDTAIRSKFATSIPRLSILIQEQVHSHGLTLKSVLNIVIVMASQASTPESPVNLLAYLRSKSSIDYDCLDLKGRTEIKDSVCDANYFVVATDLGPFVDCTSNQARKSD